MGRCCILIGVYERVIVIGVYEHCCLVLSHDALFMYMSMFLNL